MFSMLQSEHCAILFMRELAAHECPISIAEFSRLHNVSEANAKLVAKKLKSANLVKSREGFGGGYVLNRAPATISFLDILTAVSGPINMSTCTSGQHACDCANELCSMRQGWDTIANAFTESLQHQTLAQLVSKV